MLGKSKYKVHVLGEGECHCLLRDIQRRYPVDTRNVSIPEKRNKPGWQG